MKTRQITEQSTTTRNLQRRMNREETEVQRQEEQQQRPRSAALARLSSCRWADETYSCSAMPLRVLGVRRCSPFCLCSRRRICWWLLGGREVSLSSNISRTLARGDKQQTRGLYHTFNNNQQQHRTIVVYEKSKRV